MARDRGQCPFTRKAAKARPVKAIMEPIERSNSPPIMSSAAAIARMPSCDAGARIVMAPLSVNIDALAVNKKKMMTRTRPASAPSSGRRMASVRKDVLRSRSSAI